MEYHRVLLKLVIISYISINVESLESENVIGEGENLVTNALDYGYHLTLLGVTYEQGKRWTGLCGATLVREQYAVTAAHCLKKQGFPDKMYALLADQEVDLADPDAVLSYTRVLEVYVPTDWNFLNPNANNDANDIGVVKMDAQFTKKKHPSIQVLNYANIQDNFKGSKGLVLGRGMNTLGFDRENKLSKDHGNSDRKLRYSNIEIFNEEQSINRLQNFQCHEKFRLCGLSKPLHPQYVGLISHGDSGSGLVYEDPVKKTKTLFGVVSKSVKLRPAVPTMTYFSSISHHRDLIDLMISGDDRSGKFHKYPFRW